MDKKRILRAAALILLLAAYLALELTKTMIPAPDYAQKLAASRQTLACLESIHDLKAE